MTTHCPRCHGPWIEAAHDGDIEVVCLVCGRLRDVPEPLPLADDGDRPAVRREAGVR